MEWMLDLRLAREGFTPVNLAMLDLWMLSLGIVLSRAYLAARSL